MEPLAASLTRSSNVKVDLVMWDGAFYSIFLKDGEERCWRAFARLCDAWRSGERTVVISKSGGATICDRVLARHADELGDARFDMEIRIATPVHSTRESAQRFRNRMLLISDHDLLYRIARFVLAPVRLFIERGTGGQEVIRILALNHGGFNVDSTVAISKGTGSLYEIYGALVRNGRIETGEGE